MILSQGRLKSSIFVVIFSFEFSILPNLIDSSLITLFSAFWRLPRSGDWKEIVTAIIGSKTMWMRNLSKLPVGLSLLTIWCVHHKSKNIKKSQTKVFITSAHIDRGKVMVDFVMISEIRWHPRQKQFTSMYWKCPWYNKAKE